MKQQICAASIASVSTLGLLGSSVHADVPIVFSFVDVESWDREESDFNTILSDFVVATSGYRVSNISWDLTLTTFNGSFAEEATILVRDSSMARMAFIRPASGVDMPVNQANFQGSMDLAAIGEDFTLASDGLLLEFYEQFDDQAGAVDAVWSGTISFNVPSPGVLGIAGIAGLIGIRRTR